MAAAVLFGTAEAVAAGASVVLRATVAGGLVEVTATSDDGGGGGAAAGGMETMSGAAQSPVWPRASGWAAGIAEGGSRGPAEGGSARLRWGVAASEAVTGGHRTAGGTGVGATFRQVWSAWVRLPQSEAADAAARPAQAACGAEAAHASDCSVIVPLAALLHNATLSVPRFTMATSVVGCVNSLLTTTTRPTGLPSAAERANVALAMSSCPAGGSRRHRAAHRRALGLPKRRR